MAKAEHIAHGNDLFDPGGVTELVKVSVAGNLERVLEGELAVGAFFFSDPALHVFVAVLDTSVATE